MSGLCKAYKRVSREDRNQREKGELGLSYTNPLARQLSVRLDKLDLISRDHRLSVIVTPSRLTSTSTPTSSPPPPIPPRTCQPLLGPNLPPEHSPHSPGCSDLSSVHDNVFDQETDPSLSVPFLPPSFRYHAQSLVSGIMQEEEKNLRVKQELLYFKMQIFDPADIDESNLDKVSDKLKTFEDALDQFMEEIASLLVSQSDTLGPDRVEEWKSIQSSIVKDSKEYIKKVNTKASLVKKSITPSFPSTAPMHAQSQVTTSMFQKEHLDEIRRQNDILERTQQEKENERQESSRMSFLRLQIGAGGAHARSKLHRSL